MLVPGAARAAERLHGVVLAVQPGAGTAVVQHDAYAGMPGMTMTFRIVPRSRLAQLHPGAVIDATVDRASEPWTLSRVEDAGVRKLTESQSPFRRVSRLAIGDPVPAGKFVDQTGRPFTMTDLRGNDVILSFIYTRCQDARMCPLISAKFRQLQQKIGTRPIRLVELSLDPAFDRPAVLARYGRTFGADPRHWSLVTGATEPVLDFAARFGINAFPDTPLNIIHNEATVLIGPDGRVAQIISETSWLPDELLAQIDAAHGRSANPVARLNLWLSSTAVALCGNGVSSFSGFTDLLVVVVIVLALAYAMYRLARKIFAESA